MNKKHFSLILLGLMLSLAAIAQSITLNMQKVRLDVVFAQITEQTGLKVSYSSPTVDPARLVSIKVSNETPAAVLDQLLSGMNLKYEITSTEIILSAAPAAADKKSTTQKMSGVVVDANGEPVIGASVMAVGTSIGTITDFDGKFTIEAAKGAKLQISYIGYKTLEMAGANDMKVTLHEDNELLEEVVVVGYGTQKRVNLTGAVSTVDQKTIAARPVPSPVQALQGADPSLNIVQASGDPAAGYSMNIRGASSLTSGASPLVLIDGVEGSLTRLNANDIESVSILKDASAAAVYGARASAGVVLITTKNGKEGKINVTYDGRVGWSQNTTSTDYHTTGFWNAYINDLFMNAYQGSGYTNYTGFEEALTDNRTGDYAELWARINDKTENPARPWVMTDPTTGEYKYYANFDWYNYLYKKTRVQHEHNVTIKGGNDKINFYVSGRYYHQDGMMNVAKDPYYNLSLRTKVNAKINKWLSFSNNTSFYTSTREYPGVTNMATTFKKSYVHGLASVPATNPNGTPVYINTASSSDYTLMDGHSAILTYNKHKNTNTEREIRTTNRFDITPVKQLKVSAEYTYAFRYRLYQNRYVNVPYEQYEGVTQWLTTGNCEDWYQEQHYRTHDHNLNVYATYEDTFNDAHHLTIMVGTQFETFHADNMKMRKLDLASEDLNAFDLASGEVTESTGSINEWSTLGFFGRVNYDYKGRYLVEFSARGDGSSRFAPSNRWGFFPSGSLGWRMSEEKWWEPVSRVWSNNKIRFSAGALGNQSIDDYYTYIETMNLNQSLSYAFDPTTYAYYSYADDPKAKDLTWETTVTYDLGWDVGLFRNRLNLSVDGYIRDTKNMLVTGMALPNVYGASVPKSNSSDMRTIGWELSIGWNDTKRLCGKPFEYSISFGIGDYTAKVTRYDNPNKIIDTNVNDGSNTYYEGQNLGEIWGYHVDGLFSSDEEAAAYQATVQTEGTVGSRVLEGALVNPVTGEKGWRAGDMKFVDVNGDGAINMGQSTLADHGDLVVIGNSLPRFNYNLKLGFNWYGVDLNLFFQGIGHQDWYPNRNSLAFWGPYSRPYCTFIPTDYMDNVWSEENTDAYFPRARGYIALQENGPLGAVNDRYLQNVAYFRLKNLTLGYTLPIPKNKVLESARIYFSGENLFYFSPLKKHTKYIDPEQATSTKTADANSGVAYNFSRTFSVGVNIVF